MSPKETAYIVERLAIRFMALVADHERQLSEHRASFGARTEADAKIIEGLRSELQEARRNACLPGESLNEAITRTDRELDTAREQRDSIQVERDALRAEVADLRGIFDMVHASLGIKRGDHIGKAIEALKSQSTPTTKQHPVNGGEWVRKTTDGLMYKIGDAFRLESYEIKDGQIWCNLDNGASWLMSVCEPCDPPEASHDTPEGKRTAEGAVEPKPGDVVRLVRVPTLKEYPHDSGCWEPNWGGIDDHMRVHYVGSNITGIRVVRAVFGLEWPVSCVEVVKGADK